MRNILAQTISNADLWTLTEEEPIQKQIKQEEWGWIGHTLRKKPESITRMA